MYLSKKRINMAGLSIGVVRAGMSCVVPTPAHAPPSPCPTLSHALKPPAGIPYAIWGFLFVICTQGFLLPKDDSKFENNLTFTMRVNYGSPNKVRTEQCTEGMPNHAAISPECTDHLGLCRCLCEPARTQH